MFVALNSVNYVGQHAACNEKYKETTNTSCERGRGRTGRGGAMHEQVELYSNHK